MVGKGKQKPASNGGVESPSVKTLFRELKAKADKAWAAFLKPYTSLFECKSFIKCAVGCHLCNGRLNHVDELLLHNSPYQVSQCSGYTVDRIRRRFV